MIEFFRCILLIIRAERKLHARLAAERERIEKANPGFRPDLLP